LYYEDGADSDEDEEQKEEVHGFVFFYPTLEKGIVKILEMTISNDEEKKDV